MVSHMIMRMILRLIIVAARITATFIIITRPAISAAPS